MSNNSNRDAYLLVSIFNCTPSMEMELLEIVLKFNEMDNYLEFPVSNFEKIKELLFAHNLFYPIHESFYSSDNKTFLFKQSFKFLRKFYHYISFQFCAEGTKSQYYFL